MVKAGALFLAALPYAAAWPEVMEMSDNILAKRAEPPPRQPLFKSGRPNTSQPPLGFNAEEQFVDVSKGSGHEFVAPKPGDIRGQCPGLNAAANHGFLPHNGIVNTAQTTTGLFDAYGMSPDLAIFLAIISIALAGDPSPEPGLSEESTRRLFLFSDGQLASRARLPQRRPGRRLPDA